jgi:hypothetical protein
MGSPPVSMRRARPPVRWATSTSNVAPFFPNQATNKPAALVYNNQTSAARSVQPARSHHPQVQHKLGEAWAAANGNSPAALASGRSVAVAFFLFSSSCLSSRWSPTHRSPRPASSSAATRARFDSTHLSPSLLSHAPGSSAPHSATDLPRAGLQPNVRVRALHG